MLPNDSTRIADESSLLIMDIVVELEDGSIANVECQKIGYAFPGQRAACYSADLLLRQYKRVKGEKGKKFSYKDIKKVYSIIFYEQSPKEFHEFPEHYIHRSKQQTDTGLEIELLQEFLFIPLDIAKKIYKNSNIRNKLESLNTEKVMEMFSKELLEMDRNTVLYMIDEMQNEIDEQKVMLQDKDAQLQDKDAQLQQKDAQLLEKEQNLEYERAENERLRALLQQAQVPVE